MWPYCCCCSAIVLTESGIEHEHLVNFSVAVPVVVGIIYICICCQYCLSDHLSCLGVAENTLIGAVIPTLVAEHVWTYNIELDIELAETLRAEIICHATGEAEFLVGVVLAVGNFLEEFSGVLRLELC